MSDKDFTKKKNLTWLEKFAKLLQSQNFYGKVELTYQKGQIVAFRKTETGKPE